MHPTPSEHQSTYLALGHRRLVDHQHSAVGYLQHTRRHPTRVHVLAGVELQRGRMGIMAMRLKMSGC